MARRRNTTSVAAATWLWKPVVVICVLVCSALLTGRSVRHMLTLRSWLNDLSADVYDGIARNQRLRKQLADLKTDRRALDRVARSRLGVVGKDEIVYVFPPPAASAAQQSAPRAGRGAKK